ncbi:MAG: hypothetical protein IPO40_12135 [Fibrobacteres bacterium]|nr:hypothetical protein [Fibrobacterota bacterium]
MSDFRREEIERYPLSLSDLPSGWCVTAIEELASELNPGFASGVHNSTGVGVPHLRPMNVDREGKIDLDVVKSVASTGGIELSAGDVLFNNTNSPELIGKTAVISFRETGFAYSNHMTCIRPASGVSSVFTASQLHFLWMTGFFKLRCVNHVNQASISSRTLANTIPFLMPPRDEQIRIVAKLEELLSDLDAGVAELKVAQAKLGQYRQSLLKAAVDGSLTAEWRKKNKPKESGAQLLERILAERRKRWEEKQLAKYREQGKAPPKGWEAAYPQPVKPDTKGLPELPAGWVWASLGQLLVCLTSGSRDWSPYYDRGNCVFVMAQNVRPWRPDFSFRQFVDPPVGDRDRARSQIQKDDLLITIVGANTGQSCRNPTDVESHFVCQSVALLRLVEPGLSEFVNAVLNSHGHGQRQFREMNYGAGRPHLSFEQIESVAVPLPPAREQTEILGQVSNGIVLMDQLRAEFDRTEISSTAQRKNILKAAFSGQLVPQDPNDEPASVLLERIRAERAAQGAKAAKRARKVKA